MYRSVLVVFFLILISATSYAQTVFPPLAEEDWHVRLCDNAIGNDYSPSTFRRSICYLPEGGVVTAAQFSDNLGGAVRIKENGKKMWQARV